MLDETLYRDARDEFIARVVPGKTFVDVGGLWQITRERVSIASDSGAISVTLLDVTPKEDPQWKQFRDHMDRLGIPSYNTISMDVHQCFDEYDVVHCSGVLYHTRNPLAFVQALRRITKEHLILTSAVTPTLMSNTAGKMELPHAAWLFLPGLRGYERNVMRAHWEPWVQNTAIGLTRDVDDWEAEDWAPWYWLPTPSALVTMCEFAGFRVVNEKYIWNNNALTLLLRAPE